MCRRSGGVGSKQQFPLLEPRQEKKHADAELSEGQPHEMARILAAWLDKHNDARCQEREVGERFVGKESGQNERQHTHNKQTEGNETERAVSEAKAAEFQQKGEHQEEC